ncbi:hypothetical protein GIB67_025476 [Kingdonia uniflora]|uniref:Uncharacterized protein n=1 Tax=Kingdonia uniflora TaxID=39325 RepID=A0A7J7PCI8_9MAGN|nr:hypothetical protein GIB67_025476 [Kingdonia uniflora]
MGESSNVKELEIAKDIPLAMVIPKTGASSSKHRYTFHLKPREVTMAYSGQIWLGMQLPFRRLVKEVLNFWEVAPCEMNGNFYEMMKEIEGPNSQTWINLRDYIDVLINSDEEWLNSVVRKLGIRRMRQKMTDSLLRNVPVTLKPSKKRGGEGMEKVKLARKASKQASTQADKGKGKVFPESLRETFQGKFDDECETNVRLKEFIKDLGYDPETLKCLLRANDPVADNAIVASMGVRVGDGAETPLVDIVAADTAIERVVGVVGSNPSTEGTGGIGAEELKGGDDVATLF